LDISFNVNLFFSLFSEFESIILTDIFIFNAYILVIKISLKRMVFSINNFREKSLFDLLLKKLIVADFKD
jgi:hypothetical protein